MLRETRTRNQDPYTNVQNFGSDLLFWTLCGQQSDSSVQWATFAYQERSTSWSLEDIQCAIGTIDDSGFTRERIRNFNES